VNAKLRYNGKIHTFPIEYINPFFFLPLPPAGTPNILIAVRHVEWHCTGTQGTGTRLLVLAELVNAR